MAVYPRPVLAAALGLLLPALAALAAPAPAARAAAAPTAAPTAALTAALTDAPVAGAPVASDRMPGDVPTRRTPWVLDGEVTKIVQVGDTMVAGGLFTTVADPMDGTRHARQNLVAFDAVTGLVSTTFNPTVDGQVQQLLPGPVPGTVYVAGDFTKINGKGPNHVQLLSVATGQAVPTFRAPSTNGGVQTIDLLPGNRLFIGGYFTKIGGVAHGQLATLDATTGALDPFLDLVTANRHNTGSGARAPIGARESGVTPAGDRMVVVGNFRTVGGLPRDQIVVLDLTGPTARVAPDWNTNGYVPICSPNAFDSYMRDVEMSPDGSFFVVATTGGPIANTLCDTAARFETYATGTALTPTWVQHSGGDTLWGVEVTRAAVFVGGHQRWMNNPNGADSAGQGSVPRPGLVALDPRSGVPLRWNPGRNPRGEAAYEVQETDAGIWVVTNTDWVGDRRYQRPRIAFFPYSEGYDTAATSTGSLPGNVHVASPASASGVLYRVNAGGPALAALDGGPDWAADTSTSPSPLHNTGSTTATWSTAVSATVNVPATTPTAVFSSERSDPVGGTELQWAFPVPAGQPVQVRLYLANRSTSTPPTRVFGVAVDGVTKLSGYNLTTDAGGANRGVMRSFDVTSDGTLNVDFLHGASGNPVVNAIEVVRLGGPDATQAVKVVGFDGSHVTSEVLSTTPGLAWGSVRNAVMVGRTLFYSEGTAMLHRRSYDGTAFGPATAVNPYVDPLWNTVLTGSGPSTQTYTGVLPTWYAQLPNVTGMFYAGGRLYYTRSGQASLYWRWFSPDSGIVGGVEGTAPGGDIAWAGTRGMFLDGDDLYVVSAASGNLLRIGFSGGVPTGTSSLADATTDWRGRAVFLASVLPNAAPSAAFTWDCTGVSCTFDATGSTDPDGSLSSYEWSFGDGEEAGEVRPQKEFAATGTYDVTLTVTDDGGLSHAVTHAVSVVKPNVPPTAAATATCDFLVCTFDASGSSDPDDPDGTLAGYAWDFGDGTSGTGASPEHTYATPGSYEATVTVTDSAGATGTATTTQVVRGAPAPSTVGYRGGAVNQGNTTTPNVTAPAAVAAGDRLLLVLSLNASTRVLGVPSGPGWTELGTTTSGSMQTRVWTRVATADDAGRRTTVPLDAAAKYTMSLAAYSGTRPGTLVHADLAETVNRAEHTTPAVDAPAGAWVVSYWADKSSATTALAPPATVSGRLAACGTSTGHVCSTLADSGAAVPTGRYDGRTATADASSAVATTWSVVLRTVEANQAPTAAFTSTCDGAVCEFDATGSADPDGSVAAYAWDFGDGETATGARPAHDFLTSGTRTVTLTVTDDEDAQGTASASVTVVRHNAAPTASFTATCSFLVCSFDAAASADADGTVTAYRWDFGDGSAPGTGPAPTHAFATAGDLEVTLTVEDDEGSSGATTRTVSPVAARPVLLAGSSVNQGNVSTPNAVVPAATGAGDRVLAVLSVNNTASSVTGYTGVTGWTLLESAASGTMRTYVFAKTADEGDAGRTARFTMDAAAKYTLSVATYAGDALPPRVAVTAEDQARTTHTTPAVPVADGDVVVSYWADKSSATTSFLAPPGTTPLQAACGTSSGRVCSLLVDSGGPVPAGSYGGLTATADAASSSATSWTVVVPQAG